MKTTNAKPLRLPPPIVMVNLFAVLAIVVTHAQVAGSTWLPDGFQKWFWQSCMYAERASFLPSEFFCAAELNLISLAPNAPTLGLTFPNKLAVVVGDWLYIDGGEIYSSQKKGYSARELLFPIGSVAGCADLRFDAVNQTFAISLSTSWTSSSVQAVANDKPIGYEYSRKPALWYDPVNGSVFSWGGFTYDNGDSKSMWAFRPDGRGGAVWEERYSQNDDFWTHFTSPGGTSFATTPLGFYSLGGALIKGGKPNFAMPGLVVYDFRERTWSNLTSAAYSGCGCAVLGQSQYVSGFGQDGLLVFLGGDSPDNHIYQTGDSMRDLSNVTAYDIHNQKWYYQKATGDVPPAREQFCMAGAQGTDNSTYEIYIYGGVSTSAESKQFIPEFAQVFVLSLPAFTWFRAPNSTVQRLYGHSCQVIGRRHMLSIGGTNPQSDVPPNIWPNGLGVFDMTLLQWTNTYDATAKPYVQPDIVKQYYSKNARYPATWDVPSLATLFGAPPVLSSTTATGPPLIGASNITTNSPTSPTPAAERQPNAKVIAGSVVGGVAGLILVLLIGKYLLILYQRRPPPVFELGTSDPRELAAHRPFSEADGKIDVGASNPYQSQSLKPRATVNTQGLGEDCYAQQDKFS
ncbi:MAG: hypothetical protein M1839_004763 [Geoglossum umbratile]|nr:MAG: hypothetical protein M1839_004763 [Geoglossum umbratile]